MLSKINLFILSIFVLSCGANNEIKKPNVILIITDDQGVGDLGINQNPNLQTPNIDRFASESIRFDNFFVSPVCAPTRSSLLTGRYSLRTGVRDTYNGGAQMSGDELTIAEILKEANYETGIFGKWHLGDNYPFRPTDQGFDESLIHLAGGIGQVGDFTNYYAKNRSYFDPILWHNNKQKKFDGYCSDIFTQKAIEFIEKNKSKQFFCYLSFNAPHTPLQVPEKYQKQYSETNFDKEIYYANQLMQMSENDINDARKIYGMISNIDENLGRLLQKLYQLEIEDNTIVIFMTDNGPQQLRYNSGLRGKKGGVYNGGIKVPFFMKVPKKFQELKKVKNLSAHIDVLPTITELCGLDLPKNITIDGRSLVPNMKGEKGEDRFLFSYWTRKQPEKYINMSLQDDNYKLIANTSFDSEIKNFEFYDMKKDPYEKVNIIDNNISKAKKFKHEMDKLLGELTASKNLKTPPRTKIGTGFENPTFLNRNDASGDRGVWAQDEIYSFWKVNFKKGTYNFNFKFKDTIKSSGTMSTEINNIIYSKKISDSTFDTIEMKQIEISEGDVDLLSFFLTSEYKRFYPFWIEIEKVK